MDPGQVSPSRGNLVACTHRLSLRQRAAKRLTQYVLIQGASPRVLRGSREASSSYGAEPYDSRRMAAELTVAAIPDPQGEGMRLLWLLRDITERTRAEEALRQAYEEFEQRVRERTAALAAEKNAVKRLAYSMSQDLRAPLVTLRGFANELRTACDLLKAALPPLLFPVEPPQRTAVSQALDHDIPEALEFIAAAVIQMDSRIQAMPDFSRR
jgi:signal transduction histidine kinase